MVMTAVELATLITAIATACVSVIGALVSAYTAVRSTQTHALVNGQSEQLKQLREDKGYAQGVKDTESTERALTGPT